MYRVVIADDEPTIRMYIKEILQMNNYDVVGDAADGFDAVEICRREKPDFAILDIRMPLLDGLEAAKIIKSESLCGFVLLLTAFSDKSIADQAKDADVMGYLVKPIDENSLIPAVEIAINKYKEIKKLKQEWGKAQDALQSRKLVDRAKGVLIDKRGMNEESAYQYLRKVAMDKGCTISQIAKIIIQTNR